MLGCIFALSLVLNADVQKVDRSIGKEPKYAGKPRYALVLIGKDEKRIWLAQDGDLLYADANGDGDLADEKPIKGKRDRITRGDTEYARVTFEVALPGKLGLIYEFYDDPEAGDFLFLYTDVAKPPFPRNDFHQCACGEGSKEFRFAEMREDCPVFRFLGALTMLRVGATTFPHGGEDDLTVRVGTHGDGRATWVSLENSRVPKEVHPLAEITFPGKNPKDPPIELIVPLKQRC